MNTDTTINRDGELTAEGLRWCACCGRTHGALFMCLSYSPEIREAVKSYEPATANGSGIACLLAPFRVRR